MALQNIKILLDKINLLFNVFMKDGLDQISNLEKELLKEQIQKLLIELDQIRTAIPDMTAEPLQPKTPSMSEHCIKNEEPIPLETKQKDVSSKNVMNKQEVASVVAQPSMGNGPKTTIIEDPKAGSKALNRGEARVFNSNKPSRSLKEIIDLNKSFILKAELFNKNHEDYTGFITELNSLQTEEASVRLVESKAKHLSWDLEGKAYELLLRAVEKRFLPLLQQ